MKKRLTLLLAGALLAVCLAGCGTGEQTRPVNAPLFDLLDEEARAFFTVYTEGAAATMTVNYDQHYAEGTVEDPAVIRDMVAALAKITVSAETNRSITDGYHSVSFYTADGVCYGFSFEHQLLDLGGKHYVLENDEDFWKLFTQTAEEYEPQD